MNAQARNYADEVRRRSLAEVSAPAAQLTSNVLTMLVPRVVVGYLWFFSYWFDAPFLSLPLPWPLVGMVVLPTTLLWYSVVYHGFAGAWTLGPIVGLVGAFVIDLTIIRAQRWFISRQPDGS